jgi:mRNA interferase MazF
VLAFGSIVLTCFPFTDLSGPKRRPALVVSRDNERRSDFDCMLYRFHGAHWARYGAACATPGTSLEVPSVVRFDKLATLDRAILAGKIGDAAADW